MEDKEQGYSIKKGKLEKWLKEHGFSLNDLAQRLGISEREMEERLDDWDYWNAEEIEKIVDFVGARWVLKILHLSPQERKRLQKKVYGRNQWQKRKD
jgi:predicted transcriptional regulator